MTPATLASQSSSPAILEPGLRLDGVDHPYGPLPAAMEAIALHPSVTSDELCERLRRRIGDVFRVPAESVVLLGRLDSVLRRIARCLPGPAVTFPPSSTDSLIRASFTAGEIARLNRGVGKQGAIELEAVADLPDEAVAIVGSPSDPLGSLLYPAEAVRLARACQSLIIDERFAEYAGFSLLPLAAEFDNIVVLRTFETWAALGDLPCAWARGSSRTAEAIGLVAQTPSSPAMAAALATLGDMPSVDATLRLVREERSRLYRLLRKFTFLEPIPSWGPFLSARVRLVSRDKLVTALLARGIHVHAPDEIGLEHVVRIALGSRLAMDRLRLALIDLAPEMVS